MQTQTKSSYKPAANHAWRQYRNRPLAVTPEEIEADKKLPSLHRFLKDIVENWDTYTVPANDFSGEYTKLKNMQQARSAQWLISFLQKTWGRKTEAYYD